MPFPTLAVDFGSLDAGGYISYPIHKIVVFGGMSLLIKGKLRIKIMLNKQVAGSLILEQMAEVPISYADEVYDSTFAHKVVRVGVMFDEGDAPPDFPICSRYGGNGFLG